ncbi:hypothetical protein KCP71_04505 [Salmonella enterica subsp. enterica]|nr:hypothetical protein KCP71_04505 [Salmonella enterica subsp. enterica]
MNAGVAGFDGDRVKRGALWLSKLERGRQPAPARTIRTTNDMPIVDPNAFRRAGSVPAAKLVPQFQRSPSTAGGDNRERTRELLVVVRRN